MEDTDKLDNVPPPVMDHLKKTFGEWLSVFDVGVEWKKDYGGYGLYIKVPKEYSTEHREERVAVWDNSGQKQKVDENGELVWKKIVTEDVRWKPLKDVNEVIQWIDLVKEHIIKKAFQKGIMLPSTNAPLDQGEKSLDVYKQQIHKV